MQLSDAFAGITRTVRVALVPALCLALGLALTACGAKEDKQADETPPVRGLKVFEVTRTAASMVRRYPSVIQPADESRLSFEIAGQLSDVTLDVGKRVKAGEVLLKLDPTTLQFEVQQAKAAYDQAEAALKNAATDFARKKQLLASGNATQAAYDVAEANLSSATAKADQSQQQYSIAAERLNKSVLKAPFDGVIAGVDAKSFATVSPGQPVLTLYSQNAFEVDFSVPATIINALHIGDEAQVVVTDLPNVSLKGKITELGSRAGQVSAFPAVVVVEENHPGLKAGMAAEVALKIGLLRGKEGFLVPIRCFALEQSETLQEGRSLRETHGGKAGVYVFDPVTSTVHARTVFTSGVRGNMMIVTDGLKEGEIIAAAGVSYLHDGQKVRRLPDGGPY